MYTFATKIRVRYGETDKMGYLYYGNYAQYLEVGRVETMRSLDLVYADMENIHGILLPVANYETKFVRPAKYDDLLTVTSTIKEMPDRFMKFYTEIHNEKGKLINVGRVTLAFITDEAKRTTAPAYMLEALKPYFE